MAEGRPGPPRGCGQLAGQLELLAVDALTPDEVDAVRAHLDTCPRCAAELAALRATARRVLEVAPIAAVPPDFADRVVAAHTSGSAPTAPPVSSPSPGPEPASVSARSEASDRRDPPAGAAGAAGSSTPRRPARRWALAAAAAALVVGIGAGVLAAKVSDRAGDVPAALGRIGVDDVRTGRLLDDSGREVGTVVVTSGERPTLVVDLAWVQGGARYGCSIVSADGQVVEVGSWAPATAEQTSWAVRVDDTAETADQVVLTGPDGGVLATATVS